MNDVARGFRSYRGGAAEFTDLMTVVREIPNRSAIRTFGTPSPASLLINAQSSKVITLQSLSAHFSPPKLSSFRAPTTRVPESTRVRANAAADALGITLGQYMELLVQLDEFDATGRPLWADQVLGPRQDPIPGMGRTNAA